MSVRASRLVIAVMAVAASTLVSRSAYACYVDSECNEGQVCQDYVCKPAPRGAQGTAGAQGAQATTGSAAPAASGEGAAPAAAPADIKATVKGGSFGIAAAFPAGGGPTIGLAYFLDRNDALRFNVGIEWDFKPANTFQFSLEPSFRHYFGGTRLKPFIEPGIFLAYEATNFDLAITCAVGAEFFIWNTFSIGAAAGLGLQMTAINNSGPIKLTTGTSNIFLAYYW